MEDKRAQTLEALEAFIQSQKALLSRTQSDLERLRQLRDQAVSEHHLVLSNLAVELKDGAFGLREGDFRQPDVPQGIDWPVFRNYDPTPLHTFASTSHEQRIRPRNQLTSEPSELQKFVRESRHVILDPVLANLEPILDSEDEEVDVLDPQSNPCPLAPDRVRGRGGLFIKRKANVNEPKHAKEQPTFPMDIDASTSTITPPSYTPEPSIKKSSRSRRPTTKARAREEDENIVAESRPRKRRVKLILGPPPVPPPTPASVAPEPEPEPEPETYPLQETQGSDDRPETYKQAWSVSEQHLLEQLLQEIPDGEKNRWKKISKAMNGRRTPRQVASRVQKYFEKLKRFGVGFNGMLSD